MARRLIAAALIAPLGAATVHAAPVVVEASPPRETSVTIYRAPDDRFGQDDRDPSDRLDGYALISEVREVDLPAGPAVVRFPGVSAGMLAESVVVSGLPAGVREKNLDAQLLSPRQLYGGWYGRPVTLRRTDAKGQMREERAVIRSAPDGAAVLETDRGFEALNCGGFTTAIVYPGVPDGLFPTPTLSLATDAPAPARVRLRLAYLAWNYDWHADYVLTLAPNLTKGRLHAWVTLASADVTSFAQTSAAVVAGQPAFSETRDDAADADPQELSYRCFTRPVPPPRVYAPGIVPAAPPALMNMGFQSAGALDEIMVSAARMKSVAEVENLGDLKLYRLPQPTTVAARGQKQVALFDPRAITLSVVHTLPLDTFDGQAPARLSVQTRNTTPNGLGLALPAGRVRVLLEHGHGALLVGQGELTDRAIKDRVEITTGPTPPVQVRQKIIHRDRAGRTVTVAVSNANRFAVRFEGTFKSTPPAAIRAPSTPLLLRDAHKVWSVRIPAHGKATLRYRVQNTG